jgi:Protein of unknown function (DUF3592)
VDAVRTIFLVIGICWLAFGVYGTVKQYRTRDWLRVRGRVFSSAAEQPHGRTTAWMHVVLYDYTFRETRYHGEHVFRQTANYRWRVKSIAQRYTAGDLIDVFVNTSDRSFYGYRSSVGANRRGDLRSVLNAHRVVRYRTAHELQSRVNSFASDVVGTGCPPYESSQIA